MGESSKEEEKSLPQRPGTSGTENVLVSHRREASVEYHKARRAEHAYKAKKRAAMARYNYNDTKSHFKEAFSHSAAGFKGLFSVVRAVPYIVGEKQEVRRAKSEAAKRKRDVEKKKKLEEALAKAEAELPPEDEEAKAEEKKDGKGKGKLRK